MEDHKVIQPYGPLLLSYEVLDVPSRAFSAAFGSPPRPSVVSVFNARDDVWESLDPAGSILTMDQEKGKVYSLGPNDIQVVDLLCYKKQWPWRKMPQAVTSREEVDDVCIANLGWDPESEALCCSEVGGTGNKVVFSLKRSDGNLKGSLCRFSHDCVTGKRTWVAVDGYDLELQTKHMGRGLFIWLLEGVDDSFGALDADTLAVSEHPLPGAIKHWTKRDEVDDLTSAGDGQILVHLRNGDLLVGPEEALFRDDETDWKLVQQVNGPKDIIRDIKHDAAGGVHGIVHIPGGTCLWKGQYEDSKLVWEDKMSKHHIGRIGRGYDHTFF